MGIFQGHQVFAIINDIAWVVVYLLLFYIIGLPKIGRGMKWSDWIRLYVFILLIPNSTYAMFEMKHLLFKDGIADSPNLMSYLVFGGVSLFGFLAAVYTCRFLIKHYAKNKGERIVYLFLLSLVLGFGGVVGLLDFASLVAIVFPPALFEIAKSLLASPSLIRLGMATSIFFFMISLLIDYFPKPSQ